MTEPVDEHQQQCLLCNEPLAAGSTQVVQKKVVKRMVQASQRRQDNRHVQLKKHDTLTVHANCAKSYCCEAGIQRAQRKLAHESLRSGDFDFKGCCFICGKDASDELIRSLTEESSEQPAITRVSDAKLKQEILDRIDESSDEKNVTIAWRLNSLESLVQERARYHDNCLVRLYKKNPELDVNERVARFCANHIDKHPKEDRFELDVITKGCKHKDFDLDVVAERLESGRMKRKICVLEDKRRVMRMSLVRQITIKRYEEKLRQERQEEKAKLEGYDDEKKKFVGQVATMLRHQILTSTSNTATEEKLPDDMKREREHILRRFTNMLRHEILKKAPKLAPGGKVVKLTEDDVPELMRDMFERLIREPGEILSEDLRNTITGLCHQIIETICEDRETDFLSPLLKVTVMNVYKQTGSTELVKEMGNLGMDTPRMIEN